MSRRGGWILLALAACRGFDPPSPELRELLRGAEPEPGPIVRIRAVVNLESPWMSGRFDGILVARRGPLPQVRLQLFPDLGGKALDLAVRTDRIVAILPQTQEGLDQSPPTTPSPLTILGISLLEAFCPVTPERLLGESEGRFVRIRPAAADDLVARLDERGRVVRREISWKGARWVERLEPGKRTVFEIRSLTLDVAVVEARTLDSVPASAFELSVPPRFRRLDP